MDETKLMRNRFEPVTTQFRLYYPNWAVGLISITTGKHVQWQYCLILASALVHVNKHVFITEG